MAKITLTNDVLVNLKIPNGVTIKNHKWFFADNAFAAMLHFDRLFTPNVVTGYCHRDLPLASNTPEEQEILALKKNILTWEQCGGHKAQR